MSLTLPQLKIASPCPVSWDSMRGDHRSRFCKQCQLHVHNVSAMTRPEVDRLMSAANGRVCLNGFVRPDGELVTQEALADLLEFHGAAPERVAAIRAAVAAGLTAAALALAACSPEPQYHGGAIAISSEVALPETPPRDAVRTGGMIQQPTVPDTMTGGAPSPDEPEVSPPSAPK